MVKVAAMMDDASVNLCREVKRRNEISTQRRYGSNEWTQDREARTRVGSVWDGIGRRGSRAQVPLILRCRVQIVVYLVWVMSATFGQSWRQWPKVSSLLQVFFSRDSRSHDGL